MSIDKRQQRARNDNSSNAFGYFHKLFSRFFAFNTKRPKPLTTNLTMEQLEARRPRYLAASMSSWFHWRMLRPARRKSSRLACRLPADP
jgi:hypothetical protein